MLPMRCNVSDDNKPPEIPGKRETMKKTVLLCAVALSVAACNDSTTNASSSSADVPRIASSYLPPAASAAPAEPPPPSHNYALEEDGEYGYQPGISEDEKSQGVATKALVMIRYRGEKNGTYVIEMPGDAGAVMRMECKEPCQYVKTKIMVGGEVLKTETVPNTSGSLMSAVFEDALDGQLKPYGKHGG
jgi:hypothetical protein